MSGPLAMRMLWRFVRLGPEDRGMFLRAWILVAMIRLGLWLAPFHRVHDGPGRRRWGRGRDRGQGGPAPGTVERVAWAVRSASRFVPRATCLTQALAVRALLDRRGVPCLVRIGVGRDASGAFLAHAWVESEGRALFGLAPAPGALAVLPTFDAPPGARPSEAP